MSEWREIEIYQVVETANTGLDAIKRAPIVEHDTGIKCLRIQDVSQGKEFNNWGFTEVEERNYRKFQLNENDIIIARTGASIGVNQFISKNLVAVFNNGLIRIRTKPELCLPKFLYYNFRTNDFDGFIESISGGTSTQPNMQINALLSFEISLPSLPEQKAIASVLSSLDDKIDLLHRQNKTLEAMAETLFRQWFVEEAQEDWEDGVLNDVISVKGGTTPSTKEPEYWDGDIYWTSPRDLSNHTSVFLFDTQRQITEKGLAKIGSGLLRSGTVLLSSRAPIGYLAITEIPLAINQGYIAIICDKVVSNNFIYLWCKKNMEEIKNSGNGSVFQEIAKSVFREISITIPPQSMLDEFDKMIKPIFSKIRTNQLQICTLEKLRDTLLPKLMGGQVRVIV